jgi:peptidoglycan/xylan/chitin deacetylase (PgdA/CDA1 family)
LYKGQFRWPDGAHIAVVFNMSWEVTPHLGTAESKERHLQKVPPTAHYGRAMRPVYETAFAETGGVQRLLDLWERHDIRASAYADGLTVSLYPDLAREVAAKGHELIVQGWQHAFLWNMSVDEQIAEIEKTNTVFEKVLGKKAAGYSSPGGHLTAETFSILAERGFTYCCGLRNAEVPFIIPVGSRKLVGMTSYAVSDTPTARGMSPREVVTMWQDYFDALYDEGQRGFPKMLAYGTHPALALAFRTRPLEDVIRYVKSKPKVWITTREEIAAWVLKEYPDMTLAQFYPEAVAADRHYGLGIGLGGEEARQVAYSYRKM